MTIQFNSALMSDPKRSFILTIKQP